jgi:NAD-dependent SIR2 family protein deacetylase
MASALQKDLHRAVEAIRRAKALIFTSGAGMGVDSGLPDFRGPEGFWRAYPALKSRGLQLESTSTPHWFKSDRQFAWGFFGHRYNLYSKATPHHGFQIILNWGRQMESGYFAYTSNVDGHLQVIFQK